MRKSLKVVVYFLTLCVLLIIIAYALIPIVLKRNGITYVAKEFNFPFVLEIKGLQITNSTLLANVEEVKIDLSLASLIGGDITGDYLVLRNGTIKLSPSEQTHIIQSQDSSSNAFPEIRLKRIELFNIHLESTGEYDSLFVMIPQVLITNLNLNKVLIIDSVTNLGSRVDWSYYPNDLKQNESNSDLSFSSIPEFNIKAVRFIQSNFNIRTPSQLHSITDFNLDISGLKSRELFNAELKKLSLQYQDTLHFDMTLNKIKINDQENVKISNIALDFPWLKLNIPELKLSKNESPFLSLHVKDSYVNTSLIGLFLPSLSLPTKDDLGIQFEGFLSYDHGRVGFEKWTMKTEEKTSLLMDGFFDLPNQSQDSLRIKFFKLHTSTSALSELLDFQIPKNQKDIVIRSTGALLGTYESLSISGDVSLNALRTHFTAALDQMHLEQKIISLDLTSEHVDPAQLLTSLPYAINLDRFRLLTKATISGNHKLKTVFFEASSKSLHINTETLTNPRLSFSFKPEGSSASVSLADLFTISLKSKNNILTEDRFQYSGSIVSKLPRLSNTNLSAGNLTSLFNGEFLRNKFDFDFKLNLDTIYFNPADYNTVYSSKGQLSVSASQNGNFYLNLSLDDHQSIKLKTSTDFYDWWKSENKWDGNYPSTALDLQFNIDSLLVNQFTGRNGMLQLENLNLRMQNNEIKAGICLNDFSIDDYRFRNVDGTGAFDAFGFSSDLKVSALYNPYSTIENVDLQITKRSDSSAAVAIRAFLPELQNDIDLNWVVSTMKASYALTLEDGQNFRLGDQQWTSTKSDGFIFDKDFHFVSGNLSIANDNQKIDFETIHEFVSIKIDELDLQPITQIVTNDSLFLGILNAKADYNVKDHSFNWSGSIAKININNNSFGTLNFKGLKNENGMEADLNIAQEFGTLEVSILQNSGPLEYELKIQELDLGLASSAISPWVHITPLTGRLDSKIKGVYDRDFIANGYIALTNTETRLYDNTIFLRADRDTLWLKNSKVYAHEFNFFDRKGNVITLNGEAKLPSFNSIDANLVSRRFEVLDSHTKDHALKGTVNIASNVKIKRESNQFKVSGSLDVLPNSSVDYRYETSIELDEREKEIEFVSFQELDQKGKKSQPIRKRINSSKSIDWNVDLNVGKSDIKIVFSETSQDYIKMSASGKLLLKTGPDDKPLFFGSLESKEGSIVYDVPMISDINFKIEHAVVSWNGALKDPKINFLASQLFRITPAGIPGMANSKELVPVTVLAKVDDRSMENFAFTFDLNSTNPKVKSWIQSLPADTREASAINLLAFGRLESSAEGGSSSYMQSVAAKMNEISRRNIKNADLSFYVDSHSKAKNSNESVDQLGYSFSKGLLNKKVKVSLGGALDFNGSHDPYQPKSSLLGSVEIDYTLSESPNVTLNAAQKSVYDGVVNGQVNESSVGITYVKRFRNFFKRIDKKNQK